MRVCCVTTLLFLLVQFNVTRSFAQEGNPREFEMKQGDTTFVMKKYFMCFLKAGEARSQTKEEAEEIQTAHLNHINELAMSGKVHLAGPFEQGGELRGILVFDVESKEEAERLAGEDPAVKAGRLTVEIIPWWAAKGSSLK